MKRHLKAVDIWQGVGHVSGLTILWAWPDGRPDEEEVVYREDFSAEAEILFPHLLSLSQAVKKRIEAGKHRRAGSGV